MVEDHLLERLFEPIDIDVRRNLEHERLVPVVGVLEILLEEPVLDRRQRD